MEVTHTGQVEQLATRIRGKTDGEDLVLRGLKPRKVHREERETSG